MCPESLGDFYHDYGTATSSAGLRQTKVNRSTIVSNVTKHQCLLRSFVPLRGACGRLRLARIMYGKFDDRVRPTQPPLSAGSSRRPLDERGDLHHIVVVQLAGGVLGRAAWGANTP